MAVYAECYLLKAILSILTESNMMTFMKEGLAIRQSYSIYKTCYKVQSGMLTLVSCHTLRGRRSKRT